MDEYQSAGERIFHAPVCKCGHKKTLHAGADADGRCVKRSCDCGRYKAPASSPTPPGTAHDSRCVYCEHGPYCTACRAPDPIPENAHVCGRCREAITRGEIAADPYYSGNWP